MKTALVVDDEELAREEMRRLLTESGGFSEILLASGEKEALHLCQEHDLSAVFLDIEMPGCDGFQLLQEIGDELPVVFTTAHSEHAVQAFSAGVVDYLVKPIEPDRLEVALQRIASMLAGHPVQESVEGEGRLSNRDRVFLRDGERFWLVTVEDIEMLETCGNYTKLFFPGGPALVRKTLKEFSERLDTRRFFRINRERVINIQKIVNIQSSPRGHLVILLANGESYEMSRHQTCEFQRRLAL